MLEVAALVVLAAIDWSLAPGSVREVAQPFLAGEIRTFTCSPAQNGSFVCDGTLADGGVFQVRGTVGADEILNVASIVYDGTKPSAFVNDVRDYLSAGTTLKSVECRLVGARPDLFPCDAHFTTGTPTMMNVGKRADGSMQIYGVVVIHNSAEGTPLIRGLPWIAGGMMLAGALGLALGLVQIHRVRKRLVVATLPLVAEQPVHLPAPGAYVLHADAPRFSMAFAGLSFALSETATGRAISSFPAILRAHSAGISRVRMALRRFFVENGGAHVLRIDGLRADRDVSPAQVVFSSAWPVGAYLWIALAMGSGLLLMAGMFVLIIVLS